MGIGRIVEFGNVNVDVNRETQQYHYGGLIASTKVLSIFLDPSIVVPVINVADDRYGSSVKNLLESFKVDMSYVKELKGAETRVYEVPCYRLLQKGEELQNVKPKPISIGNSDIITVQSLTVLYKSLHGKYVNEKLKGTNAQKHVDANLRPGSKEELRTNEKSRDMAMAGITNIDVLYANQYELYALEKDFDVDNPWKKNLPEQNLEKWAQNLCDKYRIKKIIVTDESFGCFMKKKDGQIISVSALHLGGKNRIGLGDRLRDGVVIQSYLGWTDLEGLIFGSTLAALQTLEISSFPEKLTKKLVEKTILSHEKYYLMNGINLNEFLPKII
jgi:sugar/nucleoside kinase (ribokinase family)